jgi:hypothetical protein
LSFSAYTSRMESKQAKSEEFDKFTSLVDAVLSVPKAEVDKRVSHERRLLDLQYLKEDIEAEERHKSQVIPSK